MALTADQIVVQLRADIAQYQRNMRQAAVTAEDVDRTLTNAVMGVNASTAKATAGIARMGRAFAGAFSVAVVTGLAQRFTRIADAATQMQNSLRVAGLEGAELSRVYGQLFASAQRNSAPITSLVDLYSKLALAQNELGVSSEDLIEFTDEIAVALKVAGTDATAASGSLLQLSQALGGGVVRAEEFNSILEGTPTIAQAVARGLKEAGGSVAELRKLVNEGKVSSAAWFRAFGVGSEELRRQAESSRTTVGQAMTQLGNSLVTAVGKFDKATGASGQFAQGISDLANGIDSFDASGFISEIQRIIDKFLELDEAGTSWLNEIGNSSIFSGGEQEWFNTVVSPETGEAEKKIAALERDIGILQAGIERNTEIGMDNTEAMARLAELKAELATVQAMAANLPRYIPGANMADLAREVEASRQPRVYGPDLPTFGPYVPAGWKPPAATVSIADFPSTGGRGGGFGRRRRSGGGGGKSQKTDADIITIGEEDIRDLERQISLIGKTTEEAARLRAQWSMLDAAKKAGIPINDQLNARIEAQAAQVGHLTAELEKAELAQEQFDQAVDGIADAFAGALVAGESLREGLAQVFKQIAADIINSGIRNALMGQLGGGGGFLGGLAQSIFGGGDRLTGALRLAGLPARANGGPVQAGQMYMTGEKGPEPFVPAVNGRILSVAQAQAALRGRAGGRSGGINATFAPNISIAPGVTQAELAMTMAAAQREYEQKFLPMLQKHMPSYNERYT